MSFELTAKEKLRVAIASLLGVTLDPIGHGDLTTISIWSTLYFIQLPFVLYMLWKRNHPLIKIRGAGLFTLLYITGVLFFVGDFTTNEMVHPTSKLLRNCVFTTVWLRSICGQMSAYGLLTLYTIGVYFRNRRGMTFQGIAKWTFILVIAGINVSIGVIVSLMPETRTIKFIGGMEICDLNPQFKNAVIGLSWTGLAGLLISAVVVNLMVVCKNGEAKEISLACLALVAAIVFHTVVWYQRPKYPARLAWRVAVVSVDQLAWFTAWWAVMGRSLYVCAFRGDAWVDEYNRKIDDDDK